MESKKKSGNDENKDSQSEEGESEYYKNENNEKEKYQENMENIENKNNLVLDSTKINKKKEKVSYTPKKLGQISKLKPKSMYYLLGKNVKNNKKQDGNNQEIKEIDEGNVNKSKVSRFKSMAMRNENNRIANYPISFKMDKIKKRASAGIESNTSLIKKINNIPETNDKSDNIDQNLEFFINDNEQNRIYNLKNNKITTTKYNVFTFLPKGLFYQFLRLSNMYFLFTAIIQSIPIISPLSSITAIVPLIFVLGVSLIRELVEDVVRNNYDSINNSEEVIVFRKNGFVSSASETLRSGEIIIIYENRNIPADMIVLDSGFRNGTCYVETSSLDGEKALKLKIANIKTQGIISDYVDEDSKLENIAELQECVFSGSVRVNTPNIDLNQMDGEININFENKFFDIKKSEKFPISTKEFLLKGSVLKSTNWIIGMVVYTGMENKIILNSRKARLKMSKVETSLNYYLLLVFGFLIICCIICSIMNSHYYKKNTAYYDKFIALKQSPQKESFICFFTYFLLLNTMIPISLIVSIEIVKMGLGIFIGWDVQLYSKLRRCFCKAKSVSIIEELGNVNFIFSDKTGTLTMNQLEFKYCIINNKSYEFNKIGGGKKNTNQNIKNNPMFKEMIPFGESYFIENINSRKMFLFNKEDDEENEIIREEIQILNEFWIALTLTNECMIKEEKNEIKYISTSPDDLELVKASAKQGFKLIETSMDKKKIKIGKVEKEYDILNILGFTSERKRMSIIVKEKDSDIIKIYTKGADCEISNRLSKKSKESESFEIISNGLLEFSKQGFRTLMVAYRKISKKEYELWLEKLHKDEPDFIKKKHLIEKCYDAIEGGFEILGGTVVEDRLQDKVPETIRELRTAGIKIWVLTGDKMDTVENIGLSCNLLSKNQTIFRLSVIKGDEENVKDNAYNEISSFFREFQCYLDELAKKHNLDIKFKSSNSVDKSNSINKEENSASMSYESSKKSDTEINWECFKSLKEKNFLEPFSIIIEAPILCGLFKEEELTENFLKVSYHSSTVICCRVSPSQKSQVVQKMKDFDKNAITLAIGDGGNDVSMIMEANIGIGIFGEEGTSAAQASDFAIGEFKYLKRLLFFHGRINLMRISNMILYFFYKNFVFTMQQFYYSFFSLASGQTFVDDWYITCYNLIFTALPLCVVAVTDLDVKEDDDKNAKRILSFLYQENRDTKKIFTITGFVKTLLRGIFVSLIAFYTCSFNEILNNKGFYSNIWYISIKNYIIVLIVVSNHLLIKTKFIVFYLPIVIGVTTFLFFVIFLFLNHYGLLLEFNSKASIFPSCSSPLLYLGLFLVGGFCIVIDYTIKLSSLFFENSLSSKLTINRLIKTQNSSSGVAKKGYSCMKSLYKKQNKKKVKCNSLDALENSKLNLMKKKLNSFQKNFKEGSLHYSNINVQNSIVVKTKPQSLFKNHEKDSNNRFYNQQIIECIGINNNNNSNIQINNVQIYNNH